MSEAFEIRVPQLGESVLEATIARWVKQPGEAVSVGEPVAELETEKVNIEVAAEQSGVLGEIRHPEGSTVAVGEVLGMLEAGATATTLTNGSSAAPVAQLAPADAPAGTGHPVSPVARRLAEEHGINPSVVAGSGLGGRVMKEDVLEALQLPAAAPRVPLFPAAPPAREGTDGRAPSPSAAVAAPAAAGEGPGMTASGTRAEERVHLSRRRLTIARRLVEAQQTAAMLTTFNEMDMTAVMEVRKRWRDRFKERHGVSLGFMSFFIKAAIGALKAFPAVNAELEGEELVLKRYYDIGVAVSTADGLVVPVLRDADQKTFAQIEKEVAALATRARERKLTLDELRGGTFTLTNGGVFGSLLSTPILNPPQVGILGMHKIEERPVALGGQVVIRPMMYVALTYDHRVVDGREAVSFLVRIKELIEDQETLLLEG